jgi:hypothetical protein
LPRAGRTHPSTAQALMVVVMVFMVILRVIVVA